MYSRVTENPPTAMPLLSPKGDRRLASGVSPWKTFDEDEDDSGEAPAERGRFRRRARLPPKKVIFYNKIRLAISAIGHRNTKGEKVYFAPVTPVAICDLT
jgi:hypothetical protein